MTQPFKGTVFQHLEEFRRRLWVSTAVYVAVCLLCFFHADEIMDYIINPILPHIGQVCFFSPADAFVVKIKAALLAGLLFSSPVFLSQIWIFISPALYPNEKKAILPLIFITSFLFLFGAFFSFYVVLPMTLQFLISQQTAYLKPMVSMSEYLSFLSGMMISFGVAFNLPVFILALIASGVTTVKGLNKLQRHAIVLIVVAAALLTPGPDIASQMSLAVPLLILFELSVLAGWVLETVFLKRGRTMVRS